MGNLMAFEGSHISYSVRIVFCFEATHMRDLPTGHTILIAASR